jgi:hypothetical protein
LLFENTAPVVAGNVLAVLATRVFLGTASKQEFASRVRLEATFENWKLLLEGAQAEGLAGYLAQELSRLPGWTKLAAPLRRGEFVRFVSYQTLLRELSDMLQSRHLEGLLLKGAALMQSVYAAEVGLRPLGDVDLWVPESSRRDVEAELQRRGFQQSPEGNWARADQLVDLHTDLVNSTRVPLRDCAYRLNADDFFARSLKGPMEGLSIPRPCDHLLFLCVHALKHSHSRLFWLLDIGRLLPQCPLEELEAMARATNTLRPLRYAQTLLERVFHIPNPSKPSYSLLERAYLARAARRQNLYGSGELLTCLHLPNGCVRLRYLWQLRRSSRRRLWGHLRP